MLASLLLVCAPPLLIDGQAATTAPSSTRPGGSASAPPSSTSPPSPPPAPSASSARTRRAGAAACSVGSLAYVLAKAVAVFGVPANGTTGLQLQGQGQLVVVEAMFLMSLALAAAHLAMAYRASSREKRRLHVVYRIDIEAEMAKKCYVVYIGRVPGVYEEWEDCTKQVNNFSGNIYQGYASRERWRKRSGGGTGGISGGTSS